MTRRRWRLQDWLGYAAYGWVVLACLIGGGAILLELWVKALDLPASSDGDLVMAIVFTLAALAVVFRFAAGAVEALRK